MSLMQASYMAELTGLAPELFPNSILELAEARAHNLLGFLRSETKTKTYYMWAPSTLLELDESFATVTKVEYRADVGDYTELLATEFKFLADRKLIVMTTSIPESSEAKVTYTIGWTVTTLPALVKFFIAVLVIDTLNKFKPGTVDTSLIDTKKIGDYMIKYHIDSSATSGTNSSYGQSIEQLVILIKQGSLEPGSTS